MCLLSVRHSRLLHRHFIEIEVCSDSSGKGRKRRGFFIHVDKLFDSLDVDCNASHMDVLTNMLKIIKHCGFRCTMGRG